MKKALLSVLFFVVTLYCGAQASDRVVDERGNLLYQYSSAVERDVEQPNSVRGVFTFINGARPIAISFRQEKFSSRFEWLETVGGTPLEEDKVCAITANLPAEAVVTWSYRLKPTETAGKTLVAERAALFLMNDQTEIQKKIIDERTIK